MPVHRHVLPYRRLAVRTHWVGICIFITLMFTGSVATADSAIVSGHSLGEFLVEHLGAITNHAVRFDPHMEPLTTIATRRGDDGKGPTLLEAIDQNTYDAAVVMERYYPLNRDCDTFRTGGTERSLVEAQERLRARNPSATLLFYSPWEGVDDGTDIAAWIQYERDITPLFQCVVSEVNATLAARGSSARIAYAPAHLALAELTSAVRLGSVPEISDWKRLYNEGGKDIHLNWQNGIAEYYVSLVAYGFLYGPPTDAVGVTPKVTSKLSAKGIARLKQMAASFVREHPLPALSASDCQAQAARLCSVGALFGGMYDSEAVCADDLRRVFNGGL